MACVPRPGSLLKRRRTWLLLAILLAGFALVAKGWHDTMASPRVRNASVTLPGLDPAANPLTVALLSDVHVAGPDMPPARLSRIVAQVNALEPDLVMIAGDVVSEKRTATHIYSAEEIVAPLSQLRAPLGVAVVPGNHDHWFDWSALRGELHRHGIATLQNEARTFGPLAVGGVDDAYTRRDDLPLVLDAMDDLDGARLIGPTALTYFRKCPPMCRWCWRGIRIAGRYAIPGAARLPPCHAMAIASPAARSGKAARRSS